MKRIFPNFQCIIKRQCSTRKPPNKPPVPPERFEDLPNCCSPDNNEWCLNFERPASIPACAFQTLPCNAFGPGSSKCCPYKNPEYYSYHKYTFSDVSVYLLQFRTNNAEDFGDCSNPCIDAKYTMDPKNC